MIKACPYCGVIQDTNDPCRLPTCQERQRKATVAQPESLCVGDLNQAVKDLREMLYQKQLKIQDLQAQVDQCVLPVEVKL